MTEAAQAMRKRAIRDFMSEGSVPQATQDAQSEPCEDKGRKKDNNASRPFGRKHPGGMPGYFDSIRWIQVAKRWFILETWSGN